MVGIGDRHVEGIAREPCLSRPHLRGGEGQFEYLHPGARVGEILPAQRVGQVGEAQLVQGQGAGLVGADDVHRPQGLDGAEPLDQNVFLRHAQASHGQRQGEGGQEPFGDVGDDDPHHEDQVDPERATARHPVEKERNPHEDGDAGKDAHHAGGLALQG